MNRMTEVEAVLDRVTALVESARALPMSASCVVNRGELLALVQEVRGLLPEAFEKAQGLLAERDVVIEEGRQEAERLLEQARAEHRRLVEETVVFAEAEAEAARIREETATTCTGMRREVDDYVDAKLANFEIVLGRTLKSVAKGREKLSGRHELDELQGGELEHDEPLPG